MADLTLRLLKGSPVTFAEMDSNLLALDSDSPWKVSDGHITYQGSVGIGPGVDSNYRPQYHLDFGVGDSNQQALIGTQADIKVNLDNSTTFTVYNDGTENFLIDEQGRVGIGVTAPNQPLDVQGNIQSTATVIGNQGFFTSVYDGTMTIAGGTIFNGVNATFDGTIVFGQLSDQTNVMTAFETDQLSGSSVILPASSAIKYSLDSEVRVLNQSIDSDHAWANNYINRVDSDARARDDSDRADLINQIDSDHAWTNTYIQNTDSDAQARDDSEHAWALNYLSGVDSALDSEHAWNVQEHTTLQNNIDSEHGYALSQVNRLDDRADSEHAWANNNFDSEHAWNVASHTQLQANIDSDHLWAIRNFDSEHGWAVGNFDSEHFWAKAYIEQGDSIVDSELRKQIRIQDALNDSEHAWNVAEHAELQQNIDSRADSEHAWNVASHNALQSNIDSDHAWANTYISNVDSNSRSRDDSDHAWAVNYFSQINARLDSEHVYAIAEIDSAHRNMLRDVDSDHQWANTNFNILFSSGDSEHDWNVAEHNTLRSEIDSDHAWAVSQFDSTWTAIRAIDSDNDADRGQRFDSEHAWNVSEHNTLRSEIDSDHAWAVSEFDSTWQAILAIDSDNDSDRSHRFDSEHAWNVIEHAKLESDLTFITNEFITFVGDGDSAYTSDKFDSDFALKTTDSLSEGNINLYYLDSRVDSYVDSDFVGAHQRYLHIANPAPAPVYPGEMWLDPTDSEDPQVMVWDGSTWFEFPIGGNKVAYLIVANTPPSDPVQGQMWLDTSNDANGDPKDIVMIWDGSVWFEFPSTISNQPTVRIQPSTPTDVYEGDLWLNTTTNSVLVWDGSVWFEFPQGVDSAAGGLAVSDQRFKDNVIGIESPLDKVTQVRGVEFDWNTGPREGEHDIGVIAQELETVFPELVQNKSSFGVEDAKAVDYDKLTAVLIEAVKELRDEQVQLKERIQQLENNS